MDSELTSSETPTSDNLLAGTGSEQEPGVGGTGDHPAPAAMRDPETGYLHVAGEPPSGLTAGTQVPEGDTTDLPSGSVVTDPDAQAAIMAVKEPDQIETRPDIGTPE